MSYSLATPPPHTHPPALSGHQPATKAPERLQNLSTVTVIDWKTEPGADDEASLESGRYKKGGEVTDDPQQFDHRHRCCNLLVILHRVIDSFAQAAPSYCGLSNSQLRPLLIFFQAPPPLHTKAERGYHCAQSGFYLELHMLGSTLKEAVALTLGLTRTPLTIRKERGGVPWPRWPIVCLAGVKETKVRDHEGALGSPLEASISRAEPRACT